MIQSGDTSVSADILIYHFREWRCIVMDIPALSIALNSIQTSNDIGIAVLAKNLDVMNTEGDALTKMMELSMNPGIGQNIDYLV